jgi:ATP-dependent Clp protease adaptor protein ClpS
METPVVKEPEQQKARPQKQSPKVDPKTRPKQQPPHAVILHNDPINGFDYVIGVLVKVFKYSRGKSFMLTLRAHLGGRSLVWSGTLELAELKAEQVKACGPDPRKINSGAKPLKVSVEALPG